MVKCVITSSVVTVRNVYQIMVVGKKHSEKNTVGNFYCVESRVELGHMIKSMTDFVH